MAMTPTAFHPAPPCITRGLLGRYLMEDDFPDEVCLDQEDHGASCVAGGAGSCKLVSFLNQCFLLGSESYYFMISIDLVLNLKVSGMPRTPPAALSLVCTAEC